MGNAVARLEAVATLTGAAKLRPPGASTALLGCPITGILPLSAPTGNVTVSFVVLSYAGELAVTIAADPDACPDLVVRRGLVAQEFETLGTLTTWRTTA